ncbi:ParB/RepB/Spo0J family partition protein [Halobacteriovorax sp. GB3]|uniref:ParB/RepB/Spo0J family partition protein n=1 Tax=Halobacteriovorax sp. GB3 TaxID=2719615 RepID=UPI0023604938|nr:ParB/RepB/Spo0J family partition protein [Halobacteriovorax sp. GB3]MDD0854737.1 ParB/RepB/Spo0J family partition protein [Halobacteriovorax sp. GB3]
MAKKVALGKGIASLIGSSNEDVNAKLKAKMALDEMNEQPVKEVIKEVRVEGPSLIDISQIITNPNQPRKIFKEKELEELSESIKENGIIQPLIVVKNEESGFELVAGERRLRAAKLAGLEKVPAVIKRATDKDKMVMSIIENVQRSDLNCVEEALAYYQLMDEFNLTQEEVAKKLGKERSTVANFIRILKLPRDVIELLQKEELSFGHAKILAAVKERDKCIRIAVEAAANKLSVRETEKLIKARKNTKVAQEDKTHDYFQEKLDQYRQKLEQKTGFHFQLNSSKKGGGQVVLKFNNEAEFNDIYEFLLSK